MAASFTASLSVCRTAAVIGSRANKPAMRVLAPGARGTSARYPRSTRRIPSPTRPPQSFHPPGMNVLTNLLTPPCPMPITCLCADDVHAKHLVRGGIRENLHEAVHLGICTRAAVRAIERGAANSFNKRAPVRQHGEHAAAVLDASCLQFLFCLPHGRHLVFRNTTMFTHPVPNSQHRQQHLR